MLIRQLAEELESKALSPQAMLSSKTRGRLRSEEECKIRTPFQRDRDRIIHSRHFRQLKYKTQVFLFPVSELLRTRLTHTIEVSQIARTIARGLKLNEDLVEAIALGHDLGHPPFGHAGEMVLSSLCPGGFRHAEQSLRVVDILEKEGQGLNLTFETRDGIQHHSQGRLTLLAGLKKTMPVTLEGAVVTLCDSIAYINHDIEDALAIKVISRQDLPEGPIKVLGDRHSARINTMVSDVIYQSQGANTLKMSTEVLEATNELRNYLYEYVYPNPKIRKETKKGERVLGELFEYFLANPEEVFKAISFLPEETRLERIICDYLASLSDREALMKYEQIFLPEPWTEGW